MESLYLKEVELSGYKSIQDVSVEFHKGLNLIIGKNAAGKTNFLNFLNKSLHFNYQGFVDANTNLIFENSKTIEIKTKLKPIFEDLFFNPNFKISFESELIISGEKYISEKNEDNIEKKIEEANLLFSSTFLPHGIPNEYPLVNTPLKITFKTNHVSFELLNFLNNEINPFFLSGVAYQLALTLFFAGEVSIDEIRNDLSSFFAKTTELSEILHKYSPIEEIRFSDNYNLFYEADKELYTLNNLFLEFKVNDNWLPFSSLSDGTKRLFYIISEVYDKAYYNQTGRATSKTFHKKENISRIILIEEPELGIHPHQFHKLMEFLKLESENKQIIITTHSPQALDIISEDELHRIIIAYTEFDGNTKLRHLTEKETNKAKKYIETEFLSDYWVHSDLEK